MRIAWALLACLTAGAFALPLPDVVLYGTALRDGLPVPAASGAAVSAWSEGGRVAVCTVGGEPGAGNAYVLVVPLSSPDDPIGPHVGDQVSLRLDGEETGIRVQLSEPGLVRSQLLTVGENTVRAPVLAPEPGSYEPGTQVNVTLASATPDVTLYYTLDGSDPAPGGAALTYSGAIPLTADTTLRARAYHNPGLLDPSPVATGTYLFRDDSDGDGLPDAWEQQIVLASTTLANVSQVLPVGDFDRDGRSNRREFELGTDPTHAELQVVWFDDAHDGDGDGLTENLTALAAAVRGAGATLLERRVAIDAAEFGGVDVLLLFDGETPLTPDESAAVKAFYDAAGRVLVFDDAVDATDGGQALRALLASLGVTMGTSLVAGDLDTLYPHALTAGLTAPLVTPGGLVPVDGGTALAGHGDTTGIVLAENAAGGKLVVVGSSALLVDDGRGRGANERQLVLNCLAWFGTQSWFDLSLDDGWCLISAPLTADAAAMARLCAVAEQGSVWEWDAAARLYQATARIEPTKGYWALCTQRAPTVRLTGSLPTDALAVAAPGWNLVGPVSPCPRPTAQAVVLPVWGWDGLRYFDVDIDGDAPAAPAWHVPGQLRPGHGYWLFVRRAGEPILLGTPP